MFTYIILTKKIVLVVVETSALKTTTVSIWYVSKKNADSSSADRCSFSVARLKA
jgi:hypothetical protein